MRTALLGGGMGKSSFHEAELGNRGRQNVLAEPFRAAAAAGPAAATRQRTPTGGTLPPSFSANEPA